jgi:hypothetical protein
MDQIPKMFLHVIDVNYLDGYRLWLRFNSGAEGLVDLESELYGEIFEPLLDKDLFRQVYVTSRTIEWPNGADFAPEYLYKLAELTVEAEQSVLLQIPH